MSTTALLDPYSALEMREQVIPEVYLDHDAVET